MQEVFEKIIEKLEKYIEDNCNDYEEKYNLMLHDRNFGIHKAIEIVKQVVTEYNNGWIPISSGRLPKECEDVEVTVEENEVGEKQYYNARSWLQDGRWVIKKNPYNPTVIAWRYPIAPYQPKGE